MEEICASLKHILMVFHMIMNLFAHIYSCARAYTHSHFYLFAPFLYTFLWYYTVCILCFIYIYIIYVYTSFVIKPSKWFCATCGINTPPLLFFFLYFFIHIYIERIYDFLCFFHRNTCIYAIIYTSINQMWCSRNFITEKLHHINYSQICFCFCFCFCAFFC